MFIDAAIEAGVKRFVPSEFGSDVDNKNMSEVDFMDSKAEIRKYLREKAKKGEIEYTFFQPGPFFDCMYQSVALFIVCPKNNNKFVYNQRGKSIDLFSTKSCANDDTFWY